MRNLQEALAGSVWADQDGGVVLDDVIRDGIQSKFDEFNYRVRNHGASMPKGYGAQQNAAYDPMAGARGYGAVPMNPNRNCTRGSKVPYEVADRD